MFHSVSDLPDQACARSSNYGCRLGDSFTGLCRFRRRAKKQPAKKKPIPVLGILVKTLAISSQAECHFPRAKREERCSLARVVSILRTPVCPEPLAAHEKSIGGSGKARFPSFFRRALPHRSSRRPSFEGFRIVFGTPLLHRVMGRNVNSFDLVSLRDLEERGVRFASVKVT